MLNYINDVEEFLDYLKTNDLGSLAGINASYPRYYLSYIHNKGYASRSISRKLSSLRSFYRYLAKAGIADINHFGALSSPRVEKKLPAYFYPEEIDELFNSIDVASDIGKRNYAILELLYGTGVRVSELCSLMISDIDFYNNTILVTGKGNKERYLPIYDSIKSAL